MSGLFPFRDEVTLEDDREPRLIDLDEDVADEVFDALSSRTTRQIFGELHASPQTASDLAEVTDTSVQNAQYHLEKLMAADLVEVVDTWYSERGTEMKVYAPTDESLVLFAGDDKRTTLKTLLRRLVGIFALLVPASAVAAWLGRQSGDRSTTVEVSGGGAESPDASLAAESSDVAYAAEEPTGQSSGVGVQAADGAGGAGPNITTQSADVTARSGVEVVNSTGGTDPSATFQSATPTSESTTTVDSVAATLSDTFQSALEAVPSQESADVVVQTTGGTDPALLAGVSFFLGGAFVLAVVAATWYWRS